MPQMPPASESTDGPPRSSDDIPCRTPWAGTSSAFLRRDSRDRSGIAGPAPGAACGCKESAERAPRSPEPPQPPAHALRSTRPVWRAAKRRFDVRSPSVTLLVHRPAETAPQQILEDRIVPRLVAVAQCRAEDASPAVFMHPDERVLFLVFGAHRGGQRLRS